MKRQKYPRGHLDFALLIEEIKCCAGCGRILRDDEWWTDIKVTPDVPHPVCGLVGICEATCMDKPEAKVIANWRLAAPRLIPIRPAVPIHLVVRGRCDDEALAQAIRDTFDRIPQRSGQRITEYVCSKQNSYAGHTGLRFEALGRWPGMGKCAGENMHAGHVIRFRASFVRSSSADELAETIAHELAHTEQHAEESQFNSSDERERDVEKRLRSWGFENGTKEEHKEMLCRTFDEIIRRAEQGKVAVRGQKLPSANYAGEAICEARKALSAVMRAEDRWSGK